MRSDPTDSCHGAGLRAHLLYYVAQDSCRQVPTSWLPSFENLLVLRRRLPTRIHLVLPHTYTVTDGGSRKQILSVPIRLRAARRADVQSIHKRAARARERDTHTALRILFVSWGHTLSPYGSWTVCARGTTGPFVTRHPRFHTREKVALQKLQHYARAGGEKADAVIGRRT